MNARTFAEMHDIVTFYETVILFGFATHTHTYDTMSLAIVLALGPLQGNANLI